MAGLEETCSPISTILYWLETAVRIHNETTCNPWLPPSMCTAYQEVLHVNRASPDALIECSCCDYGVTEVKCPRVHIQRLTQIKDPTVKAEYFFSLCLT